jgi:hypothetical protein
MNHEDRIRLRAFTIWVSEGRLPGREQANWEQAERELSTPNPGDRLEEPVFDTAAAVRPLFAGGDHSSGVPLASVDDQTISHADDPSNRRPSTGRSKLVGG